MLRVNARLRATTRGVATRELCTSPGDKRGYLFDDTSPVDPPRQEYSIIERLINFLSPKRGSRLWNAKDYDHRLVGTDHLGHQYYEVNVKHMPKVDGQSGSNWLRVVEREGTTNEEFYEQGNIPVLWESWLRGRRATAPTPADMEAFMKRQARMRRNISRYEASDAEARKQELRAGSTNKDGDFEPDSWSPDQDPVPQAASKDAASKDTREAWTP